MSYQKITYICGNVTEVEHRHSYKHPNNKKRVRQGRPTSEAQKKYNDRMAEATLRRLLNANFGAGDLHVTLTYSIEPKNAKEAVKNLSNFLRRTKRYLKKQNKELRYVTVTECKKKRIHHHTVLTGLDVADLMRLWGHGLVRVTPLHPNGQYKKLAAYLIKETAKTFRDSDRPSGKRWNASKNLKQPIVKTKTMRRKTWQPDPKPIKGYYIDPDTVYNGINEITGYPYQYYAMVRMQKRD